MMDQSSRPARKVGIADHIWQTFEDMASQMGSDRDALINQAMFMFARLNGFMDGAHAAPAAPAQVPRSSPSAAGPPVPAAKPVAPPRPAAAPPMLKPAQPARQAEPVDDDADRRGIQERVLETAAELERLIKSKNPSPAAQEPESDPEPPSADLDVDVGDGAAALYMMIEGGELDRIAKERFVLGRGKHCDFVINSGKVSREHAVVVRDGGEFFIEDLGSSNGTWFNKQRIKRRKIEDGDEYFICSEKVKFVYR
jgi:type IV secretory pathway VirB10-like protein